MNNNPEHNEAAVTELQENTTAAPKGLRGYSLVRVIMMGVFAVAFVVCITIAIVYKVRDLRAQGMTDQVMGGFNDITYEGSMPVNSNPIIIPSSTPEQTPSYTPSESPDETPTESSSEPRPDASTPAETEPPVDPEYQQYIQSLMDAAKDLKAKYPDFIGIITIKGDHINMQHPILQSDDNQYYVGHLIDGTANSTGEVFLDYRNNEDLLKNKNNVLYGHNMNDGSKFGQIKFFKYEEVFRTHNIMIITPDNVLTFKPFCYYRTPVVGPYTNLSFSSNSEFAEFCKSEQAKSKFKTDYQFTGGECIITLTTCYGTSTTERHCVHAVLVDISK